MTENSPYLFVQLPKLKRYTYMLRDSKLQNEAYINHSSGTYPSKTTICRVQAVQIQQHHQQNYSYILLLFLFIFSSAIFHRSQQLNIKLIHFSKVSKSVIEWKYEITSQLLLYKSHDNRAVVTCANVRPNWITKLKEKAIVISTRCQLWVQKTFMKWVPGPSSLSMVRPSKSAVAFEI